MGGRLLGEGRIGPNRQGGGGDGSGGGSGGMDGTGGGDSATTGVDSIGLGDGDVDGCSCDVRHSPQGIAGFALLLGLGALGRRRRRD